MINFPSTSLQLGNIKEKFVFPFLSLLFSPDFHFTYWIMFLVWKHAKMVLEKGIGWASIFFKNKFKKYEFNKV